MLRAFFCFRFLRGRCVFRFLPVFFLRFSPVSAFFTLAGPAQGAVQLGWPGGGPESWNMGRWPPRPSRSKFIRLSADYCNRFVKDARILVYGGRREEGGGWENYTVF